MVATDTGYKVGDTVLFGRAQGEQTLGTVIKVNRAKLKVRQDEARGSLKDHRVGTIWTVPPALCRKVTLTVPAPGRASSVTVAPAPVTPKRDDAAIMADIKNCFLGLSPENLWMDGEATRAEADRMATALRAELRTLFRELGRVVSEDEAYGLPSVTVPNVFRRPTARDAGFAKGDKVQFTAKDGTVVVGFVRQANRKSITVDPIGSTNGRYWRVGPRMLSKVT